MPAESAPVVTFELTLDDYRALQVLVCRPIKRPPFHQRVRAQLKPRTELKNISSA